jgi:hypothetical protein
MEIKAVSKHSENKIRKEGSDQPKSIELDDRQLDAIAGGKPKGTHIPKVIVETYRAK